MSINYLEIKNLKKEKKCKKKTNLYLCYLIRKFIYLEKSDFSENLNIYIKYNGLYRAMFSKPKIFSNM